MRAIELEEVEQPLDLGLVAGVERAFDAGRRPGLIDRSRARSGRVGADRGGIYERRHLSGSDGLKYPLTPTDIHFARACLIARGLYQPGEMDHHLGPSEQRLQPIACDVCQLPCRLLKASGGDTSCDSDDLTDGRIFGECSQHAGADVAAGSRDDDLHRFTITA
jgi:hypothetical protein